MKKKTGIMVTGLLAVLILCIGCASSPTESLEGGMGMLPIRQIGIATLEDLESESLTILGTVTGEGKVYAFDSTQGDTKQYGSLAYNESDRMAKSVYQTSFDPYDIALGNAVAQLIDNARALGTHFVAFPSYTVEYTSDDWIKVKASALAVQFTKK